MWINCLFKKDTYWIYRYLSSCFHDEKCYRTETCHILTFQIWHI